MSVSEACLAPFFLLVEEPEESLAVFIEFDWGVLVLVGQQSLVTQLLGVHHDGWLRIGV
jgi:hypothetical protein